MSADRPDQLSPLKRALLAIDELQAKLRAAEAAPREAIAVIGLGCRFPGAPSPASFWRLLETGASAVGDVPRDRWDVDRLYDPDPDAPGKVSTRRGSFLDRVDAFDAAFFGIAPREAAVMDPQQRLLLEVAWEALEDAGVAPDRLQGTRTGVFIGVAGNDYATLLQSLPSSTIDGHEASGIAHSIASGRLAYVLGLQGPAISVDTACSSSLVAIHLACQSLRAGESRMALAGGVNVLLTPESTIMFSKARMLAPDGLCKTFDAAADGFARGEGCGLVVLKRLRDAEADGDRVLAVIRGTAVNQDGASSGLTAPNGPAQAALIRDALADARLEPRDVSYVEAHGTGTSLGDPIEVQALGAVFREGRPATNPLFIGSLKTNVGHLEGAAGVAGLIKIVLALRAGMIPPHLHFVRPNPHIDWAALPLRVPTELTAWPQRPRRIAGVSAFGFSGTNAHLLVEAAGPAAPRAGAPLRPAHVLTLSAPTESALAQRTRDVLTVLDSVPPAERTAHFHADLCHTLNAGRAHHARRIAIVSSSVDELRARLAAVANGETPRGVRRNQVIGGQIERPRLAMLFTGQGSQYARMGEVLAATSPTYRAAFDRAADALSPFLPGDLREALGDADQLAQTNWTPPALFAVEYALSALWQSWGVQPAVVIGHSIGEFAAAVVAGILTLEGAARIVATRARLMHELQRDGSGAMAAVFAAEARVAAAMRGLEDAVAIASINGPGNSVVSGRTDAVETVLARLAADGVRATRLPVSFAFHSPLLDPMLDELERTAAAVPHAPARLTFISTLTGAPAIKGEINAAYWRRQARECVRFDAAIRAAHAAGCRAFLECGPDATLTALGRQSVDDADVAWIPSLRPAHDNWSTMTMALAELYVRGVSPDWDGVDRDAAARPLSLPTYPFERERHWIPARAPEPSVVMAPREGGSAASSVNPLFGAQFQSPALAEMIFEAHVGPTTAGWLYDHRVDERAIVPGVAFLTAALAAARHSRSAAVALADVLLLEPMRLPDTECLAAQVIVRDSAFEVYSANEDEASPRTWRRHVSGRIVPLASELSEANADGEDVSVIRARCATHIGSLAFYETLRARGLDFGPAFRGVRDIWAGEDEAIGEIALPAGLEVPGSHPHPALLDAGLQVLAGLPHRGESGRAYLPFAVDRCWFASQLPTTLWSHVRARQASGSSAVLIADVRLLTTDGRVMGEIEGLRLRPAVRLPRGEGASDALYEVRWEPVTSSASPDRLPAISELRARADHAGQQAELIDQGVLLERLETASVSCAFDTLRVLSAPPVSGAFWPSSIADDLGIVPAHRRLFARLLEMLVEGGHLTVTEGGWRVAATSASAPPWSELQALSAAWPDAPEVAILGRIAPQLPAVLTGRQDPVALLFPDGSSELVERLYHATPAAALYRGLMREWATGWVRSQPPDRPLRVLEIGGGSASMTGAILDALPPDRFHYVFTDISPTLVARARARFEGRAGIVCRVLDIERAGPDADEAPFDLILAANVLHATRDLDETIAHVQSRLSPHGWLVLAEMVRPERWIDLTFGTTDGWWRFTDTARRAHPLLTVAGWRTLLTEHGFTSVEALPDEAGTPSRVLAAQSLLTARLGPSPIAARRRLIVCADAGGAGRELAAHLLAAGCDAAIVTVPELLASDVGALRESEEVIYLAALDAGASSGEGAEEEQRALFEPLVEVTRRLALSAASPRLRFVTRGAQPVPIDRGEQGAAPAPGQAAVWGFARSVAHEQPSLGCLRVDLDPHAPVEQQAAQLLETLDATGEDEIAWREGCSLTPRLVEPATFESGPVRVHSAVPGVLDSLAVAATTRRAPGPGEVEIRVRAASLNFRDLANALGLRRDSDLLGSECAGVVTAVGPDVSTMAPGDEVIALAAGAMATYVVADARTTLPKPAGMSFEEAASLPIALLTADYALNTIGKLRAGERVLIHAAAGGVGLAAVRLALRTGAEVFATAGSPRKRAWLTSIGVHHVMDSRTLDFAAAVRARTGGRGVDVALNSLSGAHIAATLSALAEGGRFLEIGKKEIWTTAQVRASHPSIAYAALDLSDDMMRADATLMARGRELIAIAAGGGIGPLPRRVFPLHRASDAFRFLAQARHIGKVVLRVADEPPAGARFIAHPHGTYLVTGGLAGLGLLTAGWLVGHGARTLVLVGRLAPSEAAEAAIAEWRQRGVATHVVAADVSQAEAMTQLTMVLDALPPLRGVIHSAGVLDDGVLTSQRWERFAKVFAPKVWGSLALDRLTRERPLDFFVLYSSSAALTGPGGQSNHAAANAWLDAFAHAREHEGLPATTINWAAWSSVGAAMRHGVEKHIEQVGRMIAPAEGLAVLERLLLAPRTQTAVLPLDWRRLGDAPTGFAADRLFSRLIANARETVSGMSPAHAAAATDGRSGGARETGPALLARLEAVAPGRRPRVIADFVHGEARRVLGIAPARELDRRQSLPDLGLDSLMAVEFRNVLARAIDKPLSATLLFEYPTLDGLSAHLARLLDVDTPGPAAAPAASPAVDVSAGAVAPSRAAETLVTHIEDLSDEEVERLFRARVESAAGDPDV